jgi:hypothetical protein
MMNRPLRQSDSASKMLKSPYFSPAQPWRAETRLVPSKAAASEGAGGTHRTSCGPFARSMDLGERKSPYSVLPTSETR